MASPLERMIASQIYKGMKGIFLNATLVRDVANTADSDPFDPGAPTQVSYACKALPDTKTKQWATDATIQTADSQVLILVNSLTVTPAMGDRVTVRGEAFSIVKVEVDPALAVWTCWTRAA